ncbi:hypothetical protein A4H97_10505 [Niastella yeongjuensis]|uniref:Uncharacterized protein n=1 Tax=Niastella yeongjuensis TaxID=354355 RepID=A0A1V9EFQ1_9BACT|nr:hypothetical protein [Niastella yeongjuensis]OQP44784.1 hypothetical protein A4H97_10505 [Niastella yeongjuensis]SEP42437.1 hypothetical protein SAMN05660816_05999 [Niastella yeongjuensis]
MTYNINLVLQISSGEHPDPKPYGHLYDYFTILTTAADVEEERNTIAKIDEILQLETLEEKWNFAEHEFLGNIIDDNYKYYCWLDAQQYTPRLVLNYATGELYLVYVLDSFNPRFKIEKGNLLEMLSDWEKYLSSR